MSRHRVPPIEALAISVSELQLTGAANASSRVRKLTSSLLLEEWYPLSTIDEPWETGAFHVPKWKRLLQVTAAILYCCFAAALVFGYAAIKPVLKLGGASKHRCVVRSHGSEEMCVEFRLDLVFTAAAVMTNMVVLPVGAILDHFGPRVCGLIGSYFLAAGALLMAFKNSLAFVDGLVVGYLSLALGGPFVYISSFQLSYAFPRHSGCIFALLTGAFDASSVLFLLYRLLSQATDSTFTSRRVFLLYLLVLIAIAVLQFTLLPAQPYKTVGQLVEELEAVLRAFADRHPDEQPVDEETALLHEARFQDQAGLIEEIQSAVCCVKSKAGDQIQREQRTNQISGVWGVMHGYSVMAQIRSPWFILMCLYTMIETNSLNHLLATLHTQSTHILPATTPPTPTTTTLATVLDLALPLASLLIAPFTRPLLSRTSTLTTLTSLVTAATAINLLSLLPNNTPWTAYTQVGLVAIYRPVYYAAVADYCVKVFGLGSFGRVYGMMGCVAGVGGLWVVTLDGVMEEVMDWVLVVLGAVVGVVLVGFVWLERRGRRREGLLGAVERGEGVVTVLC